jgi:copper resistance protein C
MIARLIFAFVLSMPGAAFAHAFLDHAEPAVGSDIIQPPGEVKIWFTQTLEPAFSSIQVFDSNGNQVDSKDSHLDASDGKLLIVSLPPISPGEYTVIWSVVSTDTHHTHGDFKFTLKQKS